MRTVRSRNLALLTAVAWAAGCAANPPLHVALSADVEKPPRWAHLFFVDGLDRAVLRRMLAEGQLPHIRRRFVEGGVSIEDAVSCLPALTYPNCVSLATGRFPGHHGIVGNQWFDRRSLRAVDFITPQTYQSVNQEFTCPTFYDILHDRFTVVIQCPVFRGATHVLDNRVPTFLAWSVGLFQQVDELAGATLEQVCVAANRVRCWPVVVLQYFPGIDEIGHRFGSDSPAYAAALTAIDNQVGRVTAALEQLGLLDTACLALVTDHAHPPTGLKRTFDLISWMERECRLRVFEGTLTHPDYTERLAALAAYDAVVIDGSHRRSIIFIRPAAGWGAVPEVEDVDRRLTSRTAPAGPARHISDLPCVAVTARREGPDRVKLQAQGRCALVERRSTDGGKEYRLVIPADTKGDPLGYTQSPELRAMIERGWHASRAWLAATLDSQYPDFVPQIVEYFDSPRAGDLVVFLAEKWVAAGHQRGEHGSCVAEDMLIPMYFAGPGLPRSASIARARLVDVMPTLVDLLGESARLERVGPLDGVSLAEELRAARPRQP